MKSKIPQYYGANTKASKNARRLRKAQTKAEKMMWHMLRDRKISNQKFRRQHPVGPFFVDFYCHEALLVIEVDGDVHLIKEVKDRDEERQEYIENLGLRVLRFTNAEVLDEPDRVVIEIESFLKSR